MDIEIVDGEVSFLVSEKEMEERYKGKEDQLTMSLNDYIKWIYDHRIEINIDPFYLKDSKIEFNLFRKHDVDNDNEIMIDWFELNSKKLSVKILNEYNFRHKYSGKEIYPNWLNAHLLNRKIQQDLLKFFKDDIEGNRHIDELLEMMKVPKVKIDL